MNRNSLRGWALPAAFLLCLTAAPLAAAGPDDLKLQVKLVWGVNEEPKKKLKEVDAETSRKLKSIFKWERYYETSATNLVSTVGTPKRLVLSPETEVTVHHLGKTQLEVELFNKGKLVVRKKQQVSPGELLVLAGDDVNNTAWFVVFKRE